MVRDELTGAEVVIVGEERALSASAYSARRAELEAGDPRRQLHVSTENERVRAFAAAIAARDLRCAGELMHESHLSLRDDFDVSTPTLDTLVDRLMATPGVHGARLTGAGFGGCVVALATAGAVREGWHLRPAAAARVWM